MFHKDKKERENNRFFMNRKGFRNFWFKKRSFTSRGIAMWKLLYLKIARGEKVNTKNVINKRAKRKKTCAIGFILIAIVSVIVIKVDQGNASNLALKDEHNNTNDTMEHNIHDMNTDKAIDSTDEKDSSVVDESSNKSTGDESAEEETTEDKSTEDELLTDSVDILDSEEVKEEYTLEDAYLYTGYMDLHPAFAQECPIQDCDGDGSIDRVYKEYNKDTDQTSIRLDFGNGTSVMLTEKAWGQWFGVEHGDLTGDGKEEVIFYQYLISTGGFMIGTSIFSMDEKGYTKMEVPFEVNDEFTTNQLALPVSLTKTGDHSVLLRQPDSGYEVEIQTMNQSEDDGEYYDEMEHLWWEEIDGKVIDYPAQDVKMIDSEDHSKKLLYLSTYLGDKWCDIKVEWILEYENQQWTIKKVLA